MQNSNSKTCVPDIIQTDPNYPSKSHPNAQNRQGQIAEEEKKEREQLAKKRKEEEVKAKVEAEAKAKAKAEVTAQATAIASSKDKPEKGTVFESEPKKPFKVGLCIKTSMPPPNDTSHKRPGPLDLLSTNKLSIPSVLPSLLETARFIKDISTIQYPEGIQGPKPGLNVGAKDGKFSYDRDFLLQFMSICKEMPNSLLEASRFSGKGRSVTSNASVATSTGRKAIPADQHSPEIVDRKVRALLNKLTIERFDSISDQIIKWANISEKEKDSRTLIQVIRLILEHAIGDTTWSDMYARLCRKMMEGISHQLQDGTIRNVEGRPIAGGQLVRNYLLNCCQEAFERGLELKRATAADNKRPEVKKRVEGEVKGYFDDYYTAPKAKRRVRGVVKLLSELFKLQMFTERIMHDCIKKLLSNMDNPDEEHIESVCELFTTVGAILDTNSKAQAHMNIYFSRMRGLTQNPNVSPRLQFIIQDVIELRERNWMARVAAPTILVAVYG